MALANISGLHWNTVQQCRIWPPLIIILWEGEMKRHELVDVIAPLCRMYYNYLQGCQRTAQTCCPHTLQIVGYIYRLCDSLLHLFVSLSLPLTCCNNDVRLSLSQAQFFPAVPTDCITSNTFLCSSHTSGSIALLVITSEKRDWNECFRNVPNIRLCWTKPPQQRTLITQTSSSSNGWRCSLYSQCIIHYRGYFSFTKFHCEETLSLLDM